MATEKKAVNKLDILLKSAEEENRHCRNLQIRAQDLIFSLKRSDYKNKKHFEAVLELSRSADPRGPKNVDAWNFFVQDFSKNSKYLEVIKNINPVCLGFDLNFALFQEVFEVAPTKFSEEEKLRTAKLGIQLIESILDAQKPTLY